MEEINCIFCDIPGDRVVIEENGYKGKQCPQCGLIYISPRPSLDQIIDLYGHDDAHITAEDHIADEFRKRLYARHHLNVLRRTANSGDLLEVGAGAGFFLEEARKSGFNVYGLEFNPLQAEFIRDKLQIPCEESAVKTSVFNNKTFDVVYHCDVISHFYHPFEDFKETNRVLKKGGILMFETGNYGEMDPRYYTYIDTFMYPDHLFFFTIDNLTTLLDQTGFDVVSIHRYSILPQLMLKKALAKVRRMIKGPARKPASGEEAATPESVRRPSPNGESTLKKTLRIIKSSFTYILRYKLGKIAPKHTRPQTVLVIAKKRG